MQDVDVPDTDSRTRDARLAAALIGIDLDVLDGFHAIIVSQISVPCRSTLNTSGIAVLETGIRFTQQSVQTLARNCRKEQNIAAGFRSQSILHVRRAWQL